MNRAALYLRSSKDRSDVSIDAQRRALAELAVAKRFVVAKEYVDAVESGKDDDRPGFQALLRAIEDRARGWEQLLVLDTSRIARRVFIISAFEHDCEKHGIGIAYKNLPDMDPAEQMLFKTILQGMDQYHSLKSRAKGLAGMSENIRQGWRAGGRAPRGYQLEYHGTGAMREGEPVLKSKLVPSEDAPMVAAFLAARARGEPRGTAIARLKIAWPAESLNGMEWNALTYAGHTVWNVHAERTPEGYKGGEKRRPRGEWVIQKDTHPALITTADAEAILTQIERGRTRRTRATERAYLLTGLLVTPSGAPWSGEWDVRGNAAMYRAGKGRKIAARRIDGPVLDRLAQDLTSDTAVDQVLAAMRKIVGAPADPKRTAELEKKIGAVALKIGRIVDIMATEGPSTIDAYRRSIAAAEAERARLMDELAEAREAATRAKTAREFTRADALRLTRLLFQQITTATEAGQTTEIKNALAELIERIELDPVSEACTIRYRVDAASLTGFELASPGPTQLIPVSWTTRVQLYARRRAA